MVSSLPTQIYVSKQFERICVCMAHVCVLNNNHKTFLLFTQTTYNKHLPEEVVVLILLNLCLNVVVFLTPHNYNLIIIIYNLTDRLAF